MEKSGAMSGIKDHMIYNGVSKVFSTSLHLTKQTVNNQETTLSDGEGRGCDLLCNLQGPRISKLTRVWMIIKIWWQKLYSTKGLTILQCPLNHHLKYVTLIM